MVCDIMEASSSQTLHLMPTGDAEIVDKKHGYYLIKFESGETLHFPCEFIDNLSESTDQEFTE